MQRFQNRILCSASFAVIALAGFAAPASAQDTQAAPGAPANCDTVPAGQERDACVAAQTGLGSTTDAEGQAGEVVVTGSRIRVPDTYSTSSPIDVITRADQILTGARSTAEVLQSTTVTSGSAQINNTFLGFVSEGGPGANTVGLRGLGSQRTLVLLNGRRLAPAGAGPQLVSADLNVLPSAVVQRVEILREGASSVYGSDAVAGVINIITDTRFDGVTLDAYTDQPTASGGGRSYRLSLVAGKTFERGHILASLEYRETTGMRTGDRRRYRCPTDYQFDPDTGEYVGQLTPDGQPRCFPFNNGAGTAQNYLLGINLTDGSVNRFGYVDGDINNVVNVNDPNSRALASGRQLQDHIYTPVRTFTAYVNGAYQLEALGNAEIYGEALFNRRESHQDFLSQISIDPAQLGSEIYGGSYAGTPLEDYGYPVSPFFPNSLAAQGQNILRVFIVPPLLQTRQEVNFFRANGGIRGDLGVGNLRYDANFQYSRAAASYSVQGIDTRRFRQSLDVVAAPAGTPDEFVTVAGPGTAGAGGRYTCASNVSGGAYVPGGNCVAADLFNPSTLAGNLPNNLFNWLYQDFDSETRFEQMSAQLVIDGTLVTLPAGPVGFAVGVEFRHDKLRDTPSEAQQTGNLYNYSSGGITSGSDQVFEVFGELNVPIIRDRPFFYDLSASASARYTHYRSYGSDITYHAGLTWAPARFIRFRGNYGTSFRAPNLYEQFVADQTGFFDGSADPCNDFANSTPVGSTLYNNCLTAVGPYLNSDTNNDGIPDNFVATGGPQVVTRGGRGLIDAEKSTSWGLGMILEAPFADLSFAVDYFNVEVRGEVSTLGTNILDFCYRADDFPNNQYCAFIDPRETSQGNLTSFLNPYINIARQQVEGVDFSLRFSHDVGPGRFTANARVTRILHQYDQQFAGGDVFDYAGLLGNQGFVGGPKWTGSLDLRYAFNNWTLRYGVDYIGRMDSTQDLADTFGFDPNHNEFDFVAETYWKHNFSIQYQWQNVGQITLGVSNIFNAEPPAISTYPGGSYPRIGNYFNYSGYDFIGRSVFLNITRTF
jgi:iron complex outermembrane recepter protein